MHRRVILKMGQGSFETGFPVTLQMGDDAASPSVEVHGGLPAAPQVAQSFQQWQWAYTALGLPYRLEPKAGFAKNVSLVEDCVDSAQRLLHQMNDWLRQDSFRPVREKLLEQLNPKDTIRFLLQTHDPVLERLPWHLLQFFERYPQAEVALCSTSYERVEVPVAPRSQMRILAILGNSAGLDVATDRKLLEQLPHATVKVLEEPDRETLNDHLWSEEGWDILFFAGHSSSEVTVAEASQQRVGFLHINLEDSLTMDQIRYALQRALRTGLKIAIFNSCDGLGLAHALADLRIPQVLVMREPIPDSVAQTFLRYFLEAYSRPESLYLAVREAREKLQGLEHRYPCATWLPVIYQNPAFSPPDWPLPVPKRPQLASPPASPPRRALLSGVVSTFGAAALVWGWRLLGGLQGWELAAFDAMLALRPYEPPDDRITLITLDESDIDGQQQRNEVGYGSLTDTSLENLLAILDVHGPSVIGLDIYRPFTVNAAHPALADRLAAADNTVFICKSSDRESQGIAPPPEVPEANLGFSDFVQDGDGVVRRSLLVLTPEAKSPCGARYAFSTLVALQYLTQQGHTVAWPDRTFTVGELAMAQLTPTSGGYQNLDSGGYQLLLNYRALAHPDTIAQQIPLSDLLNDRFIPEAITDRIVLIGTIAPSVGDYHFTPFSDSRRAQDQTAGVVVQAHMVSQLISAVLDDRPLITVWPTWAEGLWIVAWAGVGGVLGGGLLYLKQRQRYGVALGAGVIVGQGVLWGMGGWLLITGAVWVPVVPATLALGLAAVGSASQMAMRSSAQAPLEGQQVAPLEG